MKPFMIWCVGEGSWSEWDVGMQGMHEQQGRARARRSMRDLAPLIFEYYGLPANVSFFGLTFAMCWCYASQRLAVGGLEGAFQATQYLAMGLFMIVGALASRASGRCAASSRLAIALGLVAAVALAPLLVLPGPWASDPMVMLGVAARPAEQRRPRRGGVFGAARAHRRMLSSCRSVRGRLGCGQQPGVYCVLWPRNVQGVDKAGCRVLLPRDGLGALHGVRRGHVRAASRISSCGAAL